MDIESNLREVKISQESEMKEIKKRRDAFRRKYKTENPNVKIPNQDLTVFEKILKTPNSGNDIRWCVDHGANLYKINDNKKYPIHIVADSLCPENLKAFLENFDKTKINVKFEDRNCLHMLISSFYNPSQQKKFKNIAECVKILIDAGCDPNSPDLRPQTPFYMLLKVQSKLDPEMHRDLVKYFIEHSDIDVYTFESDETIKMMKEQNFAIPKKVDKPVDADYLKDCLGGGYEEDFIEAFQEFKDRFGHELSSSSYENDSTAEKSTADETALLLSKRNNNSEIVIDDYRDNCAIFLIKAVENGLKDVVAFLLSQDIDINHHPQFDDPPAAFIACSRGNHEILELLLDYKVGDKDFELNVNKKFRERNLLHEVCRNFGSANEFETEHNQNYERCFDLLMCCSEIDVNQQDGYGFAPLYYAIRYKNDKATKALLKKSYVGKRNIFNTAQIYHIGKDVFEEFLNDCITHEVHEPTGEQKFTIDFNFLVAPKNDGQEFFEEIAPLEDIANNKELRELILHPVLSTFLFLKWIKLSIMFYTNLIFFFFFMGSFTTYIVLYKTDTFFALSIFFLVLMMMKEVLQCFLSYKNYFKSKMNWFEVILIVLIWIVLLETQYKSIHDGLADVVGAKTLRIIKGVTILCATYEFLILFGDLPNFSVSTHMVILRRVFITFLKSIGLYSILLVGFAFCFYTLFGHETDESQVSEANATKDGDDDEDFHHFKYPGFAIIKTIVMFTGELEASNLKLGSNDASYSIIFVMFVFLISIVLLNLINGLTVTDVFQIKAEGHLIDLCQKIHVLNKYERIIMGRKSSMRCFKKIVSIFPEFVRGGKIEIDQDSKIRLGSSNVDSTFENFYDRLFKVIVSILNFINKEEKSFKKKPKSDGFRIKIDSNIMRKVKNVIEERTESKEKKEKMDLIESKLKKLDGMEEKLANILITLQERL